MNIAVAIDDVHHEALPAQAKPARAEAHRRCLWLLDLPPERHRDVLGAVRRLCGARACTAGGPTGAQLFNQVSVAIETACLLVSSYTCGLMSLAVNSRRRVGTYFFAVITFVLGAAFLVSRSANSPA